MNLRHKLKKIKSNISVILKLDVFYSRLSFSQEGEDILLDKLFAPDYVGFYVDVGAHHPYRYSNTNRLYKRGWRGINVDVDVSAIELFDKARPHDFNINIAVSTKTGKVNYYQFTESALNTISKRNYKRVITSGQSKFTEEIKVKTQSLAKILGKYAKRKPIDLLNVDVEGAEMEVLRSNDWSKFKPKVIAVEFIWEKDILGVTKSPLYKFLRAKGYSLIIKTVNCLFFVQKDLKIPIRSYHL